MLYVILCMSPGRCWRWLPSPCCTSSSSRWWSWRWLAASWSAQRPPCTTRPAPGQPGHGHVTQLYMWHVERGQHLQQSVEAADALCSGLGVVSTLLCYCYHWTKIQTDDALTSAKLIGSLSIILDWRMDMGSGLWSFRFNWSIMCWLVLP